MLYHCPTERGKVLWEGRGICWNNLWLSACVDSYQHLKQPRERMGRRTCSEAQKNEALC